MKKNIFLRSFLIILVLLIGLFIPFNVCAKEDKNKSNSSDDFTFQVYKNEIYINAYKGNEEEVIIPSEINGMPVVGIKSLNKIIKKVTIPETVTWIDDFAFYGYSDIESINISNRNPVYEDGDANAIIEKDTKKMIFGCKNTIIPEDIKSLGSAFAYCGDLKKIYIPKGLTEISIGAFSWCSGIEDIKVDPDNPVYSDLNSNGIFSKDGKKLIKGCDSTIIPENVLEICSNAFEGCSNLRSFTIPDNVISIGDRAFNECYRLNDLVLPNSVTEIGEAAFYKCKSLKMIIIPNTIKRIESNTFYHCESLDEVLMPNSVLYIGPRAFEGCKSLTKISLSDNIVNIGMYSFYGCSKLRSITIPEGVGYIDEYTFYGCDNLVFVVFLKTSLRASSLLPFPNKCILVFKNGIQNISGLSSYAILDETNPGAAISLDDIILDDNFRDYIASNYDYNCDGKLYNAELKNIKSIDLTSKEVNDLSGIECFIYLTELCCNNNKIKKIDLSKNTELTKLKCDNNEIVELVINKNSELRELSCGNNLLSLLDVSSNSKLEILNCYNNKLSTINISNNVNLTYLQCMNNMITSLDTSNNRYLVRLYCSGNDMVSLNVSKSYDLKFLWCQNNKLKTLNVRNNTKLEDLECQSNNLDSLDISGNKALNRLYCWDNNFNSINIFNLNPEELDYYGEYLGEIEYDAKTGELVYVDVYSLGHTATPTVKPTDAPSAESIPSPTATVDAKATPTVEPGETPTVKPTTTPTEQPKSEDGVGTISADGKILTDEEGINYLVADKVTTDQLNKNVYVADKNSGKYKIAKVTKKKGKITGGEVSYIKPYNKNCKVATVKATVKIAGVTFKITSVANNAFKGCTNLTKVTIGKNITQIGKNAFNGCNNLKSVIVKATKLKKVGSKAFKDINSKAKFKLYKKKYSKYKKMIKKAKAPKTAKYTK